jgi:hypothetical protein
MAMKTKDNDKLDEVKAILRQLQRIGTGDEDGAAPPGVERSPPSRESPGREWTRNKIGAPPTLVRNTQPTPQEASVSGSATERRPASRNLKIAVAAVPAVLLVAGLSFIFWREPGQPPRPASPPNKTVELGKAQQSPTEPERKATIAAIAPSAGERPGVESIITARTSVEPSAAPPPPANHNAERISYAQRLIDEGKVVAGRSLLLDGLAERGADAALILARSYDPNSLRLIPNADALPDLNEAERWYRRWHEIAAADGLALDPHRLDRIIKAMR